MASRAAALLLASVVTACGPATIHFAGNHDNRSYTFDGTGLLNLQTSSGTFKVKADEIAVTCDGTFKRTKTGDALGIGEEYAGGADCSDGRKTTLALRTTAFGSGEGTVVDDCGNTYKVVFNANNHPIAEKFAEFKSAAKQAGRPDDRCSTRAPAAPPHRDPLS